MTLEKNSSHWLKVDYRVESLKKILTGLSDSINFLEKRVKDKSDYYDGLWFYEETEPIYGLAFIAFQNYINGSVKDVYGISSKKVESYKIGEYISNSNKTNIELIIGLANYLKHKDDDGPLHKGTQEILECFNLNTDKEADIDKSPIFEGLSILNKDWDLSLILKIVTDWREKLLKEGLDY